MRRLGVRARLAAWYAAMLAAFLLAFALASYGLLARSIRIRIDESLQETARAFATAWTGARLAEASPTLGMSEIIQRIGAGDLEIVVVDRRRGTVADQWPFASTEPRALSPGDEEIGAVMNAATAAGVHATLTSAQDGHVRRVFALPIATYGGDRLLVMVARDLSDAAGTLADVRLAFAISIPLAIALAGGFGYFLAGRALAPVGSMAEQAERIGASTLHERLPVSHPRDELGRMATAFNDVLERLEQSFEQQRQFMADASHELRTPIAVVRGEADVALGRDDRDPAEYREALEVVRDESRRMTHIVDDLLLLARADVGQAPVRLTDVAFDEVVADAVRAHRTLAAASGVSLEFAMPAEEVPVRGDAQLLRRLVTNLLDNAVKYGAQPGSVSLALAVLNDAVELRVVNAGDPIAPEVQHRLFERFYRAPGGRPLDGDRRAGAGLGLAIGRWIAEAHGGSLILERSDAAATVFVARIPVAATREVG